MHRDACFAEPAAQAISLGRRTFKLATSAAALAAIFTGFAGAPAALAADSCPNAEFRTGPSLRLPDCRAYEQVTPASKVNALKVLTTDVVNSVAARPDGGAVAYLTATGPLAGTAAMGVPTLEAATRTADGWVARSLIGPSRSRYTDSTNSAPHWVILNSDLTQAFFSASGAYAPDQTVTTDSSQNGGVFLSDGVATSWVSRPAWPGALPLQGTSDAPWMRFRPVGASDDFRTLYFHSSGTLTEDDADAGRAWNTSRATYRWSAGQLVSAGVLPDGTVDPNGSTAADYTDTGVSLTSPPQAYGVELSAFNAVSEDGALLFVSPDPASGAVTAPQLYRSQEGTPSVLLSRPWDDDASNDGEPAADSSGIVPVGGLRGGAARSMTTYAVATPDHSVVLFSTRDALTPDTADVESDVVKTYRYEAATESLTYLPDLDRVIQPVIMAPEDGPVLALSDSGDAMVYRTSSGELRLWRKAAPLRTIATGVVSTPASTAAGISHVRLAADGETVVVASSGPLRGEPNHMPGSAPSTIRSEVYHYTAATDALECVSCVPGGSPAGSALSMWGGANGYSSINNNIAMYRQATSTTADGRTVFFTTKSKLVPEDHNNVADVYRWRDGELTLFSTGSTTSHGDYFLETTPNGESVFIMSRSRLTPSDRDDIYDIYAVRVNGGFKPPALAEAPCDGDVCQGPVASTENGMPAPGSAGAGGARNAVPSRGGVRVAARQLRSGRRAVVAVRTPGAGRIVVRGAGLRVKARRVQRAARYRIGVRLRRGAARQLRQKGTLRKRVRVVFVSRDGRRAQRLLTVRFKQPRSRAHRSAMPIRQTALGRGRDR